MRENAIQAAVRLALGSIPGVVAWRNNVGVAHMLDGSVVRYGLARGSSDLIGIVTMPDGSGRFCAWEVKTRRKGSKPSDEQDLFLGLVRKLGGFACVVRSADEAVAAVARCRAGGVE